MKIQLRFYGATQRFILFLLMLILFSCKDEKVNVLIPNYEEVVDVSKSKSKLSDIVEKYRIIRLETNENCLIGKIKKIIKNNSLFFICTADAKLFVFDDNGKFLRFIGSKGNGPGEYNNISDFSVSDDGLKVAISSHRQILFYNVNDGSFIKKQTYDNFINSFVLLPNEEILAQFVGADYLIAHYDKNANIIKAFGKMSRVLELEQQVEFVELDDQSYLYRIGYTGDCYKYDYDRTNVVDYRLYGANNALTAEGLNKELEKAGPDGYLYVSDYMNHYYRTEFVKRLDKNYLILYRYQKKAHIMLFNPQENTKIDYIIQPEQVSCIEDDILFYSATNLLTSRIVWSDEISLISIVYPNLLLKHNAEVASNGIMELKGHEPISKLYSTIHEADNPILFEYYIKEI